jgi:hypothetical protein
MGNQPTILDADWWSGKGSLWYEITGGAQQDIQKEQQALLKQHSVDAKANTAGYRKALDTINQQYENDPEALIKSSLGKQADIKRNEMKKQFDNAERQTLLSAQKRGVDNSSVVDGSMNKLVSAEAKANEELESKLLEYAKSQAMLKAGQKHNVGKESLDNLIQSYNLQNLQLEQMGGSMVEDYLDFLSSVAVPVAKAAGGMG